MNECGAEILVAAAMRGQEQAFHEFTDGDARCAAAVLLEALGVTVRFTSTIATVDLCRFTLAYEEDDCSTACPECGADTYSLFSLITHLNDFHEWDFLTIARKLGPA